MLERRGRPRKGWKGPLADWIKSAGLRIDKLADELEVDPATVYRWFRGVASPSLKTAIAITEIARRSGRTLRLEDVLTPGGRSNHDEEKHAKGKGQSPPRIHTRRAGLQA